LGFPSASDRNNHESSHSPQFRCVELDCDFSKIGFNSRQALRKHRLRYHTSVSEVPLPKFGHRQPVAERNGSQISDPNLEDFLSQLPDFTSAPYVSATVSPALERGELLTQDLSYLSTSSRSDYTWQTPRAFPSLAPLEPWRDNDPERDPSNGGTGSFPTFSPPPNTPDTRPIAERDGCHVGSSDAPDALSVSSSDPLDKASCAAVYKEHTYRIVSTTPKVVVDELIDKWFRLCEAHTR